MKTFREWVADRGGAPYRIGREEQELLQMSLIRFVNKTGVTDLMKDMKPLNNGFTMTFSPNETGGRTVVKVYLDEAPFEPKRQGDLPPNLKADVMIFDARGDGLMRQPVRTMRDLHPTELSALLSQMAMN
jgi:hypothetical protein